jgi:hypothetical protein
MCEELIREALKKMYIEYGVDTSFIDDLSKEQFFRGMKGVLAELDIKRKTEYSQEHAEFIKDVYSKYC